MKYTTGIALLEMKRPLAVLLLLIGTLGSTTGFAGGSRAQRPVTGETPPHAAATGPMSSFNASPLQAERLTAIQGVGRAVLAAKHSVRPDPSAEAMHQALKAISTELVKVFREGSMSKPILKKGDRKITQVIPSASNATLTAVTASLNRRLVPGRNPKTFVEESVTPSPDTTKATGSAGVAAMPSPPVKDVDTWQHDVASLRNRLSTARTKVSAVPATAIAGAAHLTKKERQLLPLLSIKS